MCNLTLKSRNVIAAGPIAAFKGFGSGAVGRDMPDITRTASQPRCWRSILLAFVPVLAVLASWSRSRLKHMNKFGIALLLAAASSTFAGSAAAEEEDERPAAGIKDNSFLIDEAYNQDVGELQHVLTLQRQNRDWLLTFGQEWALGSQAHQLGYSVPYSWLRSTGRRTHGFGDIEINYRYQAWFESAKMPAFAPGISLILPTGSRINGTGEGSLGYEILLPFSKIVSDRVTLHANAGMTSFFDVAGHQPTSFKLGGSAIYAVRRDFNLMLETVGEWNESVNDMREIEREFTLTISPGFRAALNFSNDAQFVLGLAAPITLARDTKPDFGVFLYLSFEHNVLQNKTK